jgi:hypothetical protein
MNFITYVTKIPAHSGLNKPNSLCNEKSTLCTGRLEDSDRAGAQDSVRYPSLEIRTLVQKVESNDYIKVRPRGGIAEKSLLKPMSMGIHDHVKHTHP